MKVLFFCVEGWAKDLMHTKFMTILSLLICYISLVIPAVCLGAILRFQMPENIWNSEVDPEKAFFLHATMPILTEEEEEELKEYENAEYINITPVSMVPLKTDGIKEAVRFPVRGIDEAFLDIVAIEGDFRALFQKINQCYIREDHLKDLRLKVGDEISLAGIPYKVAGSYRSDLIEHILIQKQEIPNFMIGKKVSQTYYFCTREVLDMNMIEKKWYEFFRSKQIESERVTFQTETTYQLMYQRYRRGYFKLFGIYGGVLSFFAVINLFSFLRLKGQKELYHHALKRSLGVSRGFLFTTVLLDSFFYSVAATILLIVSLPSLVKFFDLLTAVELSPVLYIFMFLFSFLVFAFIRGFSFWREQKQEILALLKKEGGGI